MKKLRILFSVLAFTLAIAGAFAFKMAPRVDDTAWINTSPNPDVCTRFTASCPGGDEDCVVFVPAANAYKLIYEFDDTPDCEYQLSMP